MRLKIATRKSQLAMWQSEFIKKELENTHKNLSIELEGFKTKGDILLDSPLSKIGGKGLFTKELEESMLRGDADLAVHSLKDVPSYFPDGLILAAISKREECNDSLLSYKYPSYKELPHAAIVGTTSLRRKMQLLRLRPDLKIKSLRGNINSRLQKLENGDFDAIILAYAGLKRLGFDKKVKYLYNFSLDEMIPAASQGALGIECLNKEELIKILSCINHENTVIETSIEREFIKELEGGCAVPIGVNARIIQEKIELRAILGLSDASSFLEEKYEICLKDAKGAGVKLANKMIAKGAKELLIKAKELG